MKRFYLIYRPQGFIGVEIIEQRLGDPSTIIFVINGHSRQLRTFDCMT